jgi:hypothetical protein
MKQYRDIQEWRLLLLRRLVFGVLMKTFHAQIQRR